jgi:hypothetical protein
MKGVFLRISNLPFGYSAMTLFPFVLFRGKMPDWLKNHERIHLRQQIEMLILPFYIWYIAEYLIHYLKFRDRLKAYRAISFEKEAYSNHHDPGYLRKRKFWSFFRYL